VRGISWRPCAIERRGIARGSVPRKKETEGIQVINGPHVKKLGEASQADVVGGALGSLGGPLIESCQVGYEAYAELLVGATSPQVSDSPDRSTPDFCISLYAWNMGGHCSKPLRLPRLVVDLRNAGEARDGTLRLGQRTGRSQERGWGSPRRVLGIHHEDPRRPVGELNTAVPPNGSRIGHACWRVYGVRDGDPHWALRRRARYRP